MIDIPEAVIELKARGIEAFEGAGAMLIVPVSSPDDIYDTANNVRRIFKEIGYEKSWQIDPYYFSKRQTLTDIMYNQKGDFRNEDN